MFNKVILCGRIANDLELNKTDSGKVYLKFSLAVNNVYNKKTDFVPVVLWSNNAENTYNYSKKGAKVLIEGKISVRTVERPEGKRTYFDVVGDRILFLESKGASTGNTTPYQSYQPKQTETPVVVSSATETKNNETADANINPKVNATTTTPVGDAGSSVSKNDSSNSNDEENDDGIFW